MFMCVLLTCFDLKNISIPCCYHECICQNIDVLDFTASDSVMARASASGAGDRGFDPGPGHTKDFKNGTSGYLAWLSAL